MSKQNNVHTLESFEVFSENRRTDENHVLRFFCRLMNCPSRSLYVKSVSVLYNLHLIDREHAVTDQMKQRQRT